MIGKALIEWKISGENGLLVYENGKLIEEFDGDDYGIDFGALEKPEIESFLEDYFGECEYRMKRS